jgi:hypothetical protein
MRHVLCGFALVLLLAACGEPASVAKAPENALATQARLTGMPTEQRDAVFIRAIRNADFECQHVDSARPSLPYRGLPVWEARCRNGRHYALVIGNDGIAQVIDADERRLADRAGRGQAGSSGDR